MRKDPKLRAQWGKKADQYLTWAIESMDDFDSDWRAGPQDGEGYYLGLYDKKYANVRGGIQDQPLAFNLQSLAGRTFIWLWLTTGQGRFKTRAETLARFFKDHLRLEDDAYAWSYAVYRPGEYEDTGHASMNVAFAVAPIVRISFSKRRTCAALSTASSAGMSGQTTCPPRLIARAALEKITT